MWSDTETSWASANREDVVDQLRVRPVVLVDLEPARAGVEQRLERPVVLEPGARLQPDVDRPVGETEERSLHRPGRLLEAGRDERRDAARQRRRQELRADRVDVAVDRARRRDQAVAHDRLRVRADRQVDAVADRAVAGAADPDDPAVLDPDVGLDGADERIEHERPGHDDVELARARPALDAPRADRLGVAPDRFVAGRLAVLGDPDPEVGVGRAGRGRRCVGPYRASRSSGERRVTMPALASSPPSPANRTRRTVRVSPGAQRSDAPAGRSRR